MVHFYGHLEFRLLGNGRGHHTHFAVGTDFACKLVRYPIGPLNTSNLLVAADTFTPVSETNGKIAFFKKSHMSPEGFLTITRKRLV